MIFTLSIAVSTQAFLERGSKTLFNHLIPGKVKIALTEPAWDPERGKGLWPGTSVAKNPTLTNTGTLEAIVFLKIEIPMENLILVDSGTGKKKDRQSVEVVTFSTNENWIKVDESISDNKKCYVFGYRSKLQPQEKTDSLFDVITVENYLEGEMEEGTNITIPVKAFGIQGNISEEMPDLRAVYDLYFRQK